MVKNFKLFDAGFGDQMNMDGENQTIIFQRQGLIFIFNFHVSKSIPDYEFAVPEPGDYRIILNTDRPEFGGHNRVNDSLVYTTQFHPVDDTHRLVIYNTNRAALVFERIG